MYLIVEENPNCETEERVFAESGDKRLVSAVVLNRPDGTTGWCDIIGIEGPNTFVPAMAQYVEDSAAGVAWLVTGGAWGVRLRNEGSKSDWAFDDPTQWGRPFLVLDDNSREIRFDTSPT